MKMTLLELVQDIMSDMDYDYVNSIADLPDSMQVANIVRTTYYELFTSRTWPHAGRIVQVEASTDSEKPNFMRVPERVYELRWLKYNKQGEDVTRHSWQDIDLIEPSEFLDRVMGRNSDDSRVDIIYDFNKTPLLIYNDRAPSCVTTFDDKWLVFDSWDKDVEDTLQTHKTQAMVIYEPVFTLSDEFIPDMPSKAFPYLLSEAKSVAFTSLKQMPNQKEEQRSRRQRTRLARGKYRVGNYLLNERPDWGRR